MSAKTDMPDLPPCFSYSLYSEAQMRAYGALCAAQATDRAAGVVRAIFGAIEADHIHSVRNHPYHGGRLDALEAAERSIRAGGRPA